MADSETRSLELQEKKELVAKEERTVPARYFVPFTDIFETADALTIVTEMPGVEKDRIDVTVRDDVLYIEGRIDFSNYTDLQPVYTEYNVGHYARRFALSDRIDQGKITAEIKDGVLTLVLPKAAEAKPKKIEIA